MESSTRNSSSNSRSTLGTSQREMIQSGAQDVVLRAYDRLRSWTYHAPTFLTCCAIAISRLGHRNYMVYPPPSTTRLLRSASLSTRTNYGIEKSLQEPMHLPRRNVCLSTDEGEVDVSLTKPREVHAEDGRTVVQLREEIRSSPMSGMPTENNAL